MPTRSKRLAAMVGCAAVALMGILSIAWSEPADHSTGVLAGSGAGAGGGIYVPPSTAGMVVGATNTWSAPPSTPVVGKARPPLG